MANDMPPPAEYDTEGGGGHNNECQSHLPGIIHGVRSNQSLQSGHPIRPNLVADPRPCVRQYGHIDERERSPSPTIRFTAND